MSRDDDPQEAGRAWMRGDLPSEDYFAMVRRGNRHRPARRPGIWQRIARWAKLAARPLPELVDGYCPVKECGPDGDRICMHLEGHDGDCDMQEVRP